MSEQATQQATQEPAAQQAQAQTQQAQQQAPTRPDFIPEKFWNTEKGEPNIEGMAKSYAEMERRFSASKLAEIPARPDDYQLKPETLPQGVVWDDGAAAKFAAVFHAQGVSANAAKEIAKLFVEHEMEVQKQASDAYEKQITDGTIALKKEWGPQYEQKVGKIKSVVSALGFEHTDPELFGNAKVVKFLGKVVGMLGEDTVASMRGAVAPGGKFASGTEEAHAIMMSPSHPDHAAYLSGDPTIVAKVKRLIDNS